ncbi:uncharacterized protein [Aristolochia californica]|uniref:uncharacterized protein n=1 Tax=Aristolochia californica TaxID=171875 RepID=UPI0035DFF467
MGTKVHSKSYIPGYYSMRDLNKDPNTGSWSLLYEDRMLKNGQCCNGLTSRLMDSYSAFDKEILKQTMLHHEAVFRRQVCELHRLYRVQSDLMNELHRKEVYKFPKSNPHSNPFSSCAPSEDLKKTWQVPGWPMMNSSSSGPSISATDHQQSSLNFLKEMSMSLPPTLTQIGSSRNCEILEHKQKCLSRKSFDLQLPADEYIESDDGEGSGEEKNNEVSSGAAYGINRTTGVKIENDVKLTLGTQDERNHLQETHCLADLNEPVEEMGNEEIEVSAPVKYFGTRPHPEESEGRKRSGILSCQRDFFQNNDKGRDHASASNSWLTKNEGTRPRWLSYYQESGQHNSMMKSSYPPVISQQKFNPSSELRNSGLKKGHELPSFLVSDQNNRESWFKENTTSNFVESAAYPRHGPFNSIPPNCDANAAASSSISSWRKFTTGVNQLPVAVQRLPCFDGSSTLDVLSKSSSTQNPGFTTENWDLNSSLRSYTCLGNNGSLPCASNEKFHLNSFVNVNKANLDDGGKSGYEQIDGRGPAKCLKGLDCSDVKSAKDMNLNLCLSKGCHDGFTSKELVLIDGDGVRKELSTDPTWLRTKIEDHQHNGEQEEKCSSPRFIQNFILMQYPKEADVQRIENANNPSVKKILGFPLLDRPQTSKELCGFSLSVSLQEPSETVDIMDCVKNDLSRTKSQHSMVSVRPKLEQNSSSVGFRYDINLNSTVAACKEPIDPLEISYKIDVEVPIASSVSRVVTKVTAHIDLEAPVVEEVSGKEEYVGDSLHVLPVEKGDTEETLARTAAEAILSISSAVNFSFEYTSNCLTSVPLVDSLGWFAEVVSSKAIDLEDMTNLSKRRIDADQDSSDEGSDYFESMTLKLAETNLSEYCVKSCVRDMPKEEETARTPLLTRPRKGHRRGKQRRDFQRDILPGLASLSRHEVTEDLQIIGGLMRASGCSWQTGLARRNVRNGWNSPGRGRRRQRGSNMVVQAPAPPPIAPPRQPSNSEVEVEGVSLQGWGKTTRRAPRQRYPTGNVAALLT